MNCLCRQRGQVDSESQVILIVASLGLLRDSEPDRANDRVAGDHRESNEGKQADFRQTFAPVAFQKFWSDLGNEDGLPGTNDS